MDCRSHPEWAVLVARTLPPAPLPAPLPRHPIATRRTNRHPIGPFSLFWDLIQPAVLHSLFPFLMDNFPLRHPSQHSILGHWTDPTPGNPRASLLLVWELHLPQKDISILYFWHSVKTFNRRTQWQTEQLTWSWCWRFEVETLLFRA